MNSRWAALVAGGCLIAALALPCGAAGGKTGTNERLLVIHPAGNAKEKPSWDSVYDGIVEQLTDKGYRVVDKSSAERCSMEIAATHQIEPDANRAASFGLKFFAENTIHFKTTTITKEKDDGTGALVRVSARLIDNTSSQVITSKSSDASSAGLTVGEAVEKAGRSAGKKVALSLISAMEKFYSESGRSGRIYTLIIEGSGDGFSALPLLARLEQNGSVAAARESESGGGKATIEISYLGKRDQLDRDLLQAAGELGWRLQKVRAEGNRSTWKIK